MLCCWIQLFYGICFNIIITLFFFVHTIMSTPSLIFLFNAAFLLHLWFSTWNVSIFKLQIMYINRVMLIKHYWHKVCFHFVLFIWWDEGQRRGNRVAFAWHHAKWRLACQFKVIFAERHLLLNVIMCKIIYVVALVTKA